MDYRCKSNVFTKLLVLISFMILLTISVSYGVVATSEVTNVIFNGGSNVSIFPGDPITVTMFVTTYGFYNDWRTTQYSFGGTPECIGYPEPDFAFSGDHSASFDITAPGTPGTYSMSFWSANSIGCDYLSGEYIIPDAIVVENPFICGDGTRDPGESCDAGVNNGVPCSPPYAGNCTYCSSDCEIVIIQNPSYCGDGTIDSPYEECDDGNNINGDGCSSTCHSESGYCNGEYCPAPGTIESGLCYYGTGACLSAGCDIESLPMGCYDICDPMYGPQDTEGPLTSNVLLSNSYNNGIFDVTAETEDTCTFIQTSEYFLRHSSSETCGTPGTGTAMDATDGAFNELQEDMYKNGIEFAEDGYNSICIHSRDGSGNWGSCACGYFETDTLPPEIISNVRLNSVPEPRNYLICGDDPTLYVTICDSASAIQGGEFFLDMLIPPDPVPPAWSGFWLSPQNQYIDGSWHCSDTSALIDLAYLEDGIHYINQIRGVDIVENWGRIYDQNFEYSFIKDTSVPVTEKVLDPADGVSVECDVTEANGNTLTDGCFYVKQGTTITLTTDQQDSATIYYRVFWREEDEDEWVIDQEGQGVVNQPVTITLEEDSYHLIEYWSVDQCNWEEEHRFELDIVDTEPPVSEKVIGTPKRECTNSEIEQHYPGLGDPTDGCFFTLTETPITLSCEDSEPHPVDDISLFYRNYKVGQPVPDFTKVDGTSVAFNNPDLTAYVLQWFCVDALGNTEGTHTEFDKVVSELEPRECPWGHKVRLCMLKRWVKWKIFFWKITTWFLKICGKDVSELEDIIDEMVALKKKIYQADPCADDATKTFVALKKESRDLSKKFWKAFWKTIFQKKCKSKYKHKCK
ncbi:MAG: hypothetical protein GY861_27400 [bacterium]|nr:hypothetical protein [bacterium]